MARFLLSLALLPAAAAQMCKPVAEAGYTFELQLNPEYSVAWSTTPLTASFLLKLNMTGHDYAWAGLGWSKYGRMLGNEAVCGVYKDAASTSVKQYYLDKYLKARVTETKRQTLTEESVQLVDGMLLIEFTKMNNDMYDIGSGFIWAYGYNGEVEEHLERGGYTIDLETCEVKNLDYKGVNFLMIVAHGAMMMLAYSFLMPVGVLAARSRSLRPAGDKVWFYTHICAQFLAMTAAAIAFGIVYAAVDVPAAHRDHGHSKHSKLGAAVLLATVIQFAMGAARPHKDAKHELSLARKIFNVVHATWGFGLLVLSFVTIQTGMYHSNALDYIDPVDAWFISQIVLAIVFVFFMLLLTALSLYKQYARVGDDELEKGGKPDEEKNGDVEPK
ncbi:hypothetical protein M885DRAFT_203714 [Pelagophyceae sp. CCMP2097]|nr:hypothetical protein M885DRAFT_203714 [Pelagophyceae sp. CCMP2097]|mmetsp:Transcript_1492/g.5484  ORF Transcript_1492/g.5484 Transcript_1492/m.5484 type:complete len:387 (+) Transcript_1492:334-1494(+)